MQKLSLLILVLSFLFITSNCVTHDVQVKNINNGIELNSYDINLKIQFYNQDVIRVVKWPYKSKSDKQSLAVIKNQLPKLDLKFSENNNELFLISKQLTLKISKVDFSIEFISEDKHTILKEYGEP